MNKKKFCEEVQKVSLNENDILIIKLSGACGVDEYKAVEDLMDECFLEINIKAHFIIVPDDIKFEKLSFEKLKSMGLKKDE